MIVGIGLDLAEIPRIARMVERWGERFTHKIFTAGERAFAEGRAFPARHYAARFAAKEATLKALCVPRGLSWHELEVTGGGEAAPRLRLGGRAREAAEERGIARLHLTLTHTGEVAAAMVVAEADAY
jgi:holo-[acyl-carrier protein] synthase